MDISSIFGIDKQNDENTIFLSNLTSTEFKREDMTIISVVNTNDPNYYYDVFQSYIDSNLNYEENEKIIELLNKAILKKSNNYVYFIVDNNPNEIEKDILSELK